MKKKNKIVAMVLGITLGVGALAGAGFGIFRGVNKVKGTEAAKILLARENMVDGDREFSWNEMITNNALQTLDKTYVVTNRLLSNESLGTLVHDSPAGKVYKSNGEYNFQDISGASYQGLVIESRIADIEFRVEQAAENINYLKNELNIVNKWVRDGYSKYYLDVTSNHETLIEYYEDDIGQKSLWVVERETRENASSTYTIMYNDMVEGVLDNPVVLVYTPDERYEYYYGHDGGTPDYLIAEKDRGYWNVFMPREETYYNVTVSENFAFHSSGNYSVTREGNYGVISTSDLREDILNNHENGMLLHLSALNGIKGIYVPEDIAYESTYDGGEKSYIDIDLTQIDKVKVKLNNGVTITEGMSFSYGANAITIENIGFDFYSNPGFADPQYNVTLSLDMGVGLNLNDKIALLKTFLDDNQMSCKYDLDKIVVNINKNSEIANAITSFYTWNGYPMNSNANFTNAESVLFETQRDFFDKYTEVKDAEEVSAFWAARVAKRQTFGSIGNISIDGATYADKKININNVSLTAEKSNLMEDGKEYLLQVGLAKIDKDGNYSSQNTVNLVTSNTIESKAYSGRDITLTATGVYDIPLALEEGKYVVVVYVATADEGIRVSSMQSIGFVDTISDTIETTATKITVKNESNKLVLDYATKLYFNVSISGETTYALLKRKMMAEMLKYGYPKQGEEIKDASGNVVPVGTITAGEYRLAFTISTADGPVTGYVVCVVTE